MITLLFSLATGLRLGDLDRDPPPFVTGGPGPNEGLYLHNAHNKAVLGSWKLDDWNSRVIYPLAATAQAFVFRVQGVGLLQARRLTAIIASLALLLFVLLARDASGPAVAALALMFLGFDPVFLVLSRIAGPAPLGILLMLITIGLWRLAVRRLWLAPVAGASLAAASVVEAAPHTLFFLATAFLALLLIRMQAWKMPWSRRARRRTRLFWLGAAVTFAAWALLFVWPYRADFLRMINTPLGSLRPGNVWINLFMAPFIFGRLIYWMPVIITIALVYLLVFARSLFAPIARHRPLSETRVWFFAWLVTAPVFMAMRFDRPFPALVLLSPPLCFAAAEALVRLLQVRDVKKPDMDIMVVLGLMLLTVWTVVQGSVHFAVLSFGDALPDRFFHHAFRYEFLITAAVVAPVVLVMSRLWLHWRRFTFRMSPATSIFVFVVLTAFVATRDGLVARGIFSAPRDIAKAAEALRPLPAGSIVAGTWAPLLSLDSGQRGLVIWPGMNDERPPAAFGATHLLLQRESSEQRLAESLDRDRAWIGTFVLGGHRLDLYRLK